MGHSRSVHLHTLTTHLVNVTAAETHEHIDSAYMCSEAPVHELKQMGFAVNCVSVHWMPGPSLSFEA